MKKDYYKILEVDKEASEEIIEKAYKTLAKKYHPDVQDTYDQKQCEEKMKEINEAYEVLSNDYKKSIYDEELKNTTLTTEEIEDLIRENRELKMQIEQLKKATNVETQNQNTYFENNYINNQPTNPHFQNPNIVYRRNRIDLKNILKIYIKRIIIIFVVILIFMLLLQIPFIKRFFYNIYNENSIIKILVDAIVKTFNNGF